MPDLTPAQRAQMDRYLENLIRWSRRVNLVGTRDPEVLRRGHVEDSLALLDVHPWKGSESVLDIGSGGGFPALPLKIARPALRVMLVEADRRKAGFLQHTAGLLGLVDFEVVTERVEAFARRLENRERFDVVTSRASAPPAVVLEYALALLQPGGVLLAQVGAIEADTLTPVARLLGGGRPRLLKAGLPGHFVLRVLKVAPTPAEYPRRVGLPAKRPLA